MINRKDVFGPVIVGIALLILIVIADYVVKKNPGVFSDDYNVSFVFIAVVVASIIGIIVLIKLIPRF